LTNSNGITLSVSFKEEKNLLEKFSILKLTKSIL